MLARPVRLNEMSVAESASLYRLLYHTSFSVARTLAAFGPAIAPLDPKWTLVEIVHTLVEHAAAYIQRLTELRVPPRLIGAASREVIESCTNVCTEASWQTALEWSAALIAQMHELVEEAHATASDLTNARDMVLLRRVGDDLTKLLSELERHNLQPSGDAYRLEWQIPAPGVPPTPTGTVPLPFVDCAQRAYPPNSVLTGEKPSLPALPETARDVARYLHESLQIEFIATDITLRNVSDFTGMPLEFYRDMARQAHDEVRHTRLLEEHMAPLGNAIGDFPFLQPDRYEMMVGQDLLFRMVILTRTGEAEAIDAISNLTPHFRAQGYEGIARMFDHVVADEIGHTLYGNKWIRFVVGDSDVEVERVTRECLNQYNDLAPVVGLKRGVYRDPNYLDSPRGKVDLEARALAGFTRGEVERLAASQQPN